MKELDKDTDKEVRSSREDLTLKNQELLEKDSTTIDVSIYTLLINNNIN
jgi:hypothetical protein